MMSVLKTIDSSDSTQVSLGILCHVGGNSKHKLSKTDFLYASVYDNLYDKIISKVFHS